MKPQLGDTISNRYVLVSPLREETGLQVWKASDHVLARDCQLFIVNSRKALQDVNATASMLAISHDAHFTQVLQLQHVGEVALVITQLDAGMSLSEYLTQSSKPLSFTAIRSILGEVVEALHVLQKDNLTHFSISTDTVRLTRNGIEIADAPVSIMLADTSRVQSVENQEQLAIRQVASLLYSLLTRTPSTLSTNYHLDAISPNVPMEFRVICKRGLDLKEKDGFPTVPMATIAELEALLGDYEPLAKLNGPDIALPSADSECSIVNVPLLQILEQDAIALPDTLAETGSIPEMTFEAPEPHTDFSDSKEALAKGMAATGGAVKSLWNNSRELLSEEDLDGSSEDVDSPFSFPIRVSTPSPQGDYHTDDSQLEKTGRIPVIGPDGRVIEPGEESARALVIATGSNYRKLGVPGETEYAGKGVSYCATCDGFFFRNKPIVVVGGGDSAFEEADFLSRFGSSVTLIHRRSTFRASRIMVERAQRNPKIDFMLDAVVQEIRGDENGVQEVEVRNTATEKTSVIPANGVFMAIGHTPATAFLNGLVDVDSAGYITVDGASTRTSEPGVFAAGDCVDSVYRQAISAAGMGCRAALDAQAYLDSLK